MVSVSLVSVVSILVSWLTVFGLCFLAILWLDFSSWYCGFCGCWILVIWLSYLEVCLFGIWLLVLHLWFSTPIYKMRMISWKCRGLRATPTSTRLQRLIKKKPDVFFLAKTLCPINLSTRFFNSVGCVI